MRASCPFSTILKSVGIGGIACAFLYSNYAEAKPRKSTGLLTHYKKSNAPAVAKLEFSQQAPQSIILINPAGEKGADTLAGVLSRSLMSPKRVRNFSSKYDKQFESYEMAKNFKSTSSLSAGSNLGMYNNKSELELRKNMARELQREMILKGIPDFIEEKSNSKEVKAAVYVATRLAESTKISGKTKARWEYSFGANPYNQSVFAEVKKGEFTSRLSTRLSKKGKRKGLFNTPEFDAAAPKEYVRADIGKKYRKHTVATSYFFQEQKAGPYYDYAFTSNLTCGLESNYSFKKKEHNNKAFMRYSF